MAADSLHDLENGKRSEMSSESSEDEDYDDYDQIRVGPDYQADIPELLSHPENNHKQRPKSLKLWFPPNNISEVQLNDYILFSKHKYGYDTEQCLGLLYWNKYDLKKSFCDLPNFSPQLNWSIIDKSNFDLAFDKFGKDFEQINTMLPDKSLKSIICYYYSWKRNKTRAWTIKPVNKLEHFCADRIQNGSSDISEPDNMFNTIILCPHNFHINFVRDRLSPPQDKYVNDDNLQSISSGSNSQGETILSAMGMRYILTTKLLDMYIRRLN